MNDGTRPGTAPRATDLSDGFGGFATRASSCRPRRRRHPARDRRPPLKTVVIAVLIALILAARSARACACSSAASTCRTCSLPGTILGDTPGAILSMPAASVVWSDRGVETVRAAG